MLLTHRITQAAAIGCLFFGLANAVQASDRTVNTLLGIGLGAATGAVLSDGDPLLILGGAAAGGLLGEVLTDDRYYDPYWRGERRSYWGGHRDYRRAGWRHDNGWHRGHHKGYRHHHHHYRH